MPLTVQNQQWLDEFYSKHGHAPRILHIGNIANNAYLNAKLLNQSGFDCDVICHDYYHIMGYPEWEDADLDTSEISDLKPSITNVKKNNFVRPNWFAQGPRHLCIDYLISKRTASSLVAATKWKLLNIANNTASATTLDLRDAMAAPRILWSFVADINNRAQKKLMRELANKLPSTEIFMHSNKFSDKKAIEDVRSQQKKLIQAFEEAFPERQDKLSYEDFDQVMSLKSYKAWTSLFQHYDLIQAYATNPILPLLAGRKYVSYEHGTIRKIPFESDAQGRLCALGYRLSDWSVITNADNMKSAHKLGIPNYSFVPHPINEDIKLPASKKEEGAPFTIFHPARQHWSDERHPDWEKSNDVFIRGFAKFVENVCPQATALMIEWGQSVNQSKKLIEQLGIKKNVRWLPPQAHHKMVELIGSSDLVADQFFLGAFGSILPKSLYLSRPCLIYLDSNYHGDCFDEMPPILNARTSEEISMRLTEAYGNRELYDNLRDNGATWYQNHHSNKIIVNKLTEIYAQIIH